MSYSLIGKIVDANTMEQLALCDLSFLKNLNERSYSCSFRDVESTVEFENIYKEKIKDITRNEEISYYCTLNATEEIMSLPMTELKDNSTPMLKAYVMDEDDIEVYKDIIKNNQDYSYAINSTTHIYLYIRKMGYENGDWFRCEDFEKGEEIIKKKLDEEKEELSRLMSLKKSKEYYEMSENAQNRLFDDIKYQEDAVEEYQWQYYSIVKIINILDFYANDLSYIKDDKECWDSRKIIVYITAD